MEERLNLIETFAEFKDFKNIERETLMRILEDIFRSVLTKKYGADANFDIIVNVDRGDLEIQRYREIVEDGEVENEYTQIALSEAVKIEPDFEVGEEVMENIRLEDFQRREILALRQNLISKIMEYEKDLIYKKYEGRIGELVSGEVTQVWRRFGARKSSWPMRKVWSWCFPRANRFPPTTTRRAIPSTPWWSVWKSSPLPPESPFRVPPRDSWNA